MKSSNARFVNLLIHIYIYILMLIHLVVLNHLTPSPPLSTTIFKEMNEFFQLFMIYWIRIRI